MSKKSIEKMKTELATLMERRAGLDNRIEKLQQNLQEARNLEVLGIVEEFGLTPEQLKVFLEKAGKSLPNRKEMEEIKEETTE